MILTSKNNFLVWSQQLKILRIYIKNLIYRKTSGEQSETGVQIKIIG